jgi:SET domain-containing protein
MILVEEKDKRFYLGESTIKDAGLGVFASEDIKKDDYLEIIGVMVDIDSTTDKCTDYARFYKFAANFPGKFDRHIIPMGFGAIINHTDDPKVQNVELRYIRHSSSNPSAGSAVYSFTKDVKKGEEILGNYGPDYQKRLDDEKYWRMFLDLELYNLGKLKR